jgi:hypothetical protein
VVNVGSDDVVGDAIGVGETKSVGTELETNDASPLGTLDVVREGTMDGVEMTVGDGIGVGATKSMGTELGTIDDTSLGTKD